MRWVILKIYGFVCVSVKSIAQSEEQQKCFKVKNQKLFSLISMYISNEILPIRLVDLLNLIDLLTSNTFEENERITWLLIQSSKLYCLCKNYSAKWYRFWHVPGHATQIIAGQQFISIYNDLFHPQAQHMKFHCSHNTLCHRSLFATCDQTRYNLPLRISNHFLLFGLLSWLML